MALTFTHDYNDVHGKTRVWVGDIVFDASYTDNGEVIAASDFDLDLIKDVVVDGFALNETSDIALGCIYDRATGTLRLFESSATAIPLAEIGSTDDVALYTVRVRVYGW